MKTLGVFGKKIGMTQIYSKEGLSIPVTVVQLGENIVTRKLTKDKDGYEAIQVGAFAIKERKLTKPALGSFKKNEIAPVAPLREFHVADSATYNVGQPLPIAEILKEEMLVDVRGKSIGKGFQGTVKRYHAARGPMTHGSKFHRSMGSIGAGTTPGRVFRGTHMPGQMGNQNVCTRRTKIVRVDTDKNLLLIKGPVPGAEGSLVLISPTRLKWNG
ncbi:MAG: 50S ribosomal protein L3 [Candidatus Melainabacteria bacterium]|nr:50S ribosomal protein L3 [Candidatus Melainabacteria bacterium]